MTDLETIMQRLDALEDVTDGDEARALEFAERRDANRERVIDAIRTRRAEIQKEEEFQERKAALDRP